MEMAPPVAPPVAQAPGTVCTPAVRLEAEELTGGAKGGERRVSAGILPPVGGVPAAPAAGAMKSSVGGSRRVEAGASASSGTKGMRQLTLSGAFFSRASKALGAKGAPACTVGKPTVAETHGAGLEEAVEGQRSDEAVAQVGGRGKAEAAERGEDKAVEQEGPCLNGGRAGRRRIAGKARAREAAIQSSGGQVALTRSVARERATEASQENPARGPEEGVSPKLQARSRQDTGLGGDSTQQVALAERNADGFEEEVGAAAGEEKPDPANTGEGTADGPSALIAKDEESDKGESEEEGEAESDDKVQEQGQDKSPGSSGPSDGLTDYERLRLENIKRNQMLMASLGLQGKAAAVAQTLGGSSAVSSGKARPKGPLRKRKVNANVVEGARIGDLGVRRSQRLRKGPGAGEEEGKEGDEKPGKRSGAGKGEDEGDSAEVIEWYNDSSVVRYICGNKRTRAADVRSPDTTGEAREAANAESGGRCRDASLEDAPACEAGSSKQPGGSTAGVQNMRRPGREEESAMDRDGVSGARAGRGHGTPRDCTAVPSRLSFAGVPLQDPALTRIYSIHVLSLEDGAGVDTHNAGTDRSPLGGRGGSAARGKEAGAGVGGGAQAVPGGRRLVVAAGHNGRISVFGWPGPEGEEEVEEEEGDGEEEDGDGEGAKGMLLLSWKGHGGWISHVQFLANQGTADSTLLLSSSNDRTVTLWDINRQQEQAPGPKKGVPQADPQGAPKVVHRSVCPWHTQGVFGMHQAGGLVATASKDRSVGVLRVHPWGSLELQRLLQGHHEGAVRGVHFRDTTTLADCGADSLLCIHDLREPEGSGGETTPSLVIEEAHSSPINTVQWHPSNPHWVLSASHDPIIRIHDLRRASEPLHTLAGHVKPGVHRCRNIYRPAFAFGGRLVVSPGEGSESVSVFCLDPEPRLLSRGHLERNANLAAVECAGSLEGQGTMLWLGGRDILPLQLE